MSDWSTNRKSEAHFHTSYCYYCRHLWVIRSIHQCGQDPATHTAIQISSMMVKDQILSIWDGKHMHMYTSGGRPANILVCCAWVRLHHTRHGIIIHRSEKALDIQSDWIFASIIMDLRQEWNLHSPTSLPSPATPPSPLVAAPAGDFPVYATSRALG